jgi:outer membrane protein OmpU
MKSILLASASVLAFAGVAVAQDSESTDGVSFSGTAEFGYNDTNGSKVDDDNNLALDDNGKPKYEDEKEGFYWESDIAVKLSRELNNGLNASVTFNIDVADDDDTTALGNVLDSSGFVLALTSEDAGIYFGDTKFAAQSFWPDADVDEMNADGFSEQDNEVVLRGEVTYGTVKGALSYVVADGKGNRPAGDVDQLSLGAGFAFGGYTFGIAYQDESDAETDTETDLDDPDTKDVDESLSYGPEDYAARNSDFNTDSIFAIGLKAELAGLDSAIAYAQNITDDESSLGIGVSYPIGAFAINAYYVMEDGTRTEGKKEVDQEDAWGIGATYEDGPITLEAAYKQTNGEDDSRIEGTYDIGNGIKLWAGGVSALKDYYIASTVDLGGGAQLLLSYGVDDDASEEDEIGNPDIQAGATVEVSLAF